MATQRNDLEVRVLGRDDLSPQFDKIESRLIRFVGAVGAGLAAIRITSAPITAAADFERELANVRKTTNFLSADMRLLSRELLSLSTRIDVSAVDLAKIAAAAGQQGLGREGVAGVVQFTESVARMASVLDITAEQAAEDIGKIANIFKTPLSEIERVVSIFNEASNNSTAKGEELLDVVRRIGDAAGTIDLQQSVALAATGLDFGQSPEVVGTAFAKIFSSLVQKQQDFTRLLNANLGASAENWADKLRSNGLDAFKDVLEALRTLEPAAQQNTIIKLFGGGRIGALVNKLVQDTANTVLDRNLRSSQTGALGTSALQEQATVLNTLKAQATLTLNALTKAGIDATDQLLGPLTSYVIQLREAIQSPAFNSFIQAVGNAVGKTIDLLVNLTKAIASLNVNFGNFVPVVTAFLGLKLAESVLGITGRMLGLSSSLKSISTEAAGATKAMQATGAAAAAAAQQTSAAAASTRASRVAELLGYKELYDAIQRNRVARQEALSSATIIAKKQAELGAAQAASEAAGNASRAAIDRVRERSQDVKAARARVFKAIQDGNAEEAALQQTKAARITAAEQAYQQRIAAIEQDYQTRRQAIRASGTEAGLKALRAEKAASLATEEASYQRSIRGVQLYWDRRIATAAAGAKATVDAERLAYLQAVGRFDASVSAAEGQKSRFGNSVTNVNAAKAAADASAAAGAELNKTNAYLRSQGSLVGALSAAWGSATLILRTAGSILATLATGLLRVASVAVSAFAWVTILYSIADAFGLIDKALPVLQRVTDFMGFTSEASRKAAVEAQEASRRLREQREEVDALARAYDKASDSGRALLNPADVAALITKATASESRDVRVEAVKEVSQLASGSLLRLEQEQNALDAGVRRNISRLEVSVKEAQARIASLQTQAASKLGGLTKGTVEYAQAQKEIEQAVGNATRVYGSLVTALEEQRKALSNTSAVAVNAEENLRLLANATADVFTPQSVALTKQFVIPLTQAAEKVKELEKFYTAAQQEDFKNKLPDPSPTTKKALEDLQSANREVANLRKEFATIVQGLQALPGLPEAVKKSINDTLAFLSLSSREAKALVALADKAGADAQTGKKAGINTTGSPTGTNLFDPKLTGQESLARRLRRAELDLQKAQNEAEANLEQERFRRLQSISDSEYERGLVDYRNYYETRQKIQLAGIDSEIRQRTQDLADINFQATKPGLDPAEQARFQADRARLTGQIQVLVDRKNTIQQQTQEDIRKAGEAFDRSVLSSVASLTEQGLIPAEAIDVFKSQLASLREAARTEFARLRAEGRADVAAGLDRSLNLQAVETAFQSEARKFDAALRQLDLAKAKIDQAKSAGSLTTLDAETALRTTVQQAVPGLNALVDAQQAFLDSVSDLGVRASPAFKALELAVASTRSQIRGLSAEVNETARQINQNLTQELATILQNMRLSVDGVKNAFLSFLRAIGNQILQTAARQAAEGIMGALGSLGDKGIGGLVSKLVGGSGKKPSGNKGDPLYVVEGSPPEVLEDIVATGKETAFSVKGMWDGVVGALQKSDNVFLQGLGNLLAFLGPAFSSLISAIFSSSAADSAGGGGGLLDSIFAAFGHTGGVIGDKRLVHRLVAPEAFRKAKKYHGGGVLGRLKSNEVPFVGLKGEEVITEDDPRHVDNLSASTAGGGKGMRDLNVWVVTPDQKPTFGPNDVVAVIADNIERRGSIRQLIKRVQLGGG